jgi:polar amino acid transport system substrate-binding protein
MLKFLTRTVMSFLAATFVFVSAAEALTLDEILKAGVIRVGVHPNLPPNSVLKPDGAWGGMDIDTGNLIAEALGVKAEFVAIQSPQRVPMLVSDQIDFMLGGLTRNARRAKLIDYTLPTYTESQVVLTTDKWDSLTKWTDFNREDITLANVRGTVPAQWTKKNAPKAKELLFESGADVIRAIAQGRADGTIAVIDNWLLFTKDYTNVTWKVLPDTIYLGYWGIGVQKGNDGLRRWLNVWLYAFQSKNKHNALWEQWYGSPPAFPVVPTPYFP